jgi:GTP-binding protein Era
MPLVLVLNKVDRVKKERLLELAQQCNARAKFTDTFMISALGGDGVADFRAYLARTVRPGPWHYPADEIMDAPLRLLASEITREKIFERLHDELPYEITVETTSWLEQKKGIRIEQTIFVERDSQKAIVLGNGGRTIRQLSRSRAGSGRDRGETGPSVPVRQGARELGQRPRALPRAGPDLPQGLSDLRQRPLRLTNT